MNEAELLFTHELHCSRMSLYANRDTVLDKDVSVRIAEALKRRMRAEPLQYILGTTEFMGLDFIVTPEVLIPRPETEILVETAIEIIGKHGSQGHKVTKSQVCEGESHAVKILDVGTGSGCIAIALAKFLASASVDAVDISHEALAIARENARHNNAAVNFLQGDLFSCPGLRPKSYDLIVSNPPYIPSDAIDTLQPEIRWEPRRALDGGRDGLDFYRAIIHESARYVKDGGFLCMEIGYDQGDSVGSLLKESARFECAKIVKDYSDRDRVIVAQRRAF